MHINWIWCKWILPDFFVVHCALYLVARVCAPVFFGFFFSNTTQRVAKRDNVFGWHRCERQVTKARIQYAVLAHIQCSSENNSIVFGIVAFKILSLNWINSAKSIKTISFVIKINWRMWGWCSRVRVDGFVRTAHAFDIQKCSYFTGLSSSSSSFH